MGRGNSKIWDVIVIGAGAAGMMAAITAARRGLSVAVLDRMKKPGKKLLATGNGKCNFTNATMERECFHGDEALLGLLARFSHADCLAFFHELGICPKQKNGYYYPRSEQASSVVDALVSELVRLHVTLILDAELTEVTRESYGFSCQTMERVCRGQSVIFATGLLAAPRLGSDGSAFALIQGLGHHFTPILPALCGFYAEGMRFAEAAGVRCDAALTLLVEGAVAGQERGELQLVKYGLSGIPMFQLASVAARSLCEGKQVMVVLDFFPELSGQELFAELRARCGRWQTETAKRLLLGLLPQALAAVCLKTAGIPAQQPLAAVGEETLAVLLETLKAYRVRLLRPREMEYAQVCSGGVCTEELFVDRLESRFVPGVHFAGELLNVDGLCGGYNLQWAWTSGYVAGSSVGALC